MKNWVRILLIGICSFVAFSVPSLANDDTTIDNHEVPIVEETNTDSEIDKEIIEEPKEVTVEDFADAKALTIAEGTKLYSTSKFQEEIGIWNGNQSIQSFSIVDNAIQITVANVKVYVSPQSIVEAAEEKLNSDKPVGTVRTTKAFNVYSNASNTSVLLSLTKATALEVIGVQDDYFKVNVAGIVAFVAKKDVTVDLSKALKVLKATPIKTGSKTVATLTANGVIKAASVKGNTYTFNNKYTFTSDNVVETTTVPTWPKKGTASSYEVTLTAQKTAGLYNANGVKFAEIPAKSKISLANVTGEYGIVHMLGGAVYVKLSDFKHTSLIVGEKVLTYHELNYKLKVFALLYPEFVKLEEIGKSVEGRSIMAITVGTGKKEVLFDASMHAREHMTSNVLMEMVDNYSYHYIHNSKYAGFNVKSVLDKVKITFVPMINPDGVTLVQGGKVSTPRATLIKLNGGSSNFSRWKANIRGVDLNRNWDVRWSKLPKISPKWELSKGTKPFSEPETIALRDFILKHPFKAYITYHSSGQIMYWEYGNGKGGKAKATTLIKKVSNVTGYAIMKNSQTSITAASEPWASKKLDAPAITMEISPYVGNVPVPLKNWSGVWKKNKSIGLLVANQASSY